MSNQEKKEISKNTMARYIGIGIAIGAGIGVATGNLAIGIAIGVALGAAIGVSKQEQAKGKKDTPDE